MLLVAIDTSGREGSLTLAQAGDGADELKIVETIPLAGGTFSAQLIPQLSELLKRNGFSKKDIGGFAVASGPGSFTGLRVGLAAVKGLAEALQKPIAAMSLLAAVARGVRDRHVVAALDAGRNELYVGEFEDGVAIGEEELAGREEFATSVGLKVITTDEALVQRLSGMGKMVERVAHPGSAGVARLGWEKLSAGESVSPEELEANYIRRSDAEVVRGRG